MLDMALVYPIQYAAYWIYQESTQKDSTYSTVVEKLPSALILAK